MNNDRNSYNLQAQLLRCHLSAFVPLLIQEYLLGQRILSFPRPDLAQVTATHGDAILYPIPGQSAQAVSALVEALATMAFAPGGVDFLGLHFEVPPRQALAVLEEQTLLRSMPPGRSPSPQSVETAQTGQKDDCSSSTFEELYRRQASLRPPPEEG